MTAISEIPRQRLNLKRKFDAQRENKWGGTYFFVVFIDEAGREYVMFSPRSWSAVAGWNFVEFTPVETSTYKGREQTKIKDALILEDADELSEADLILANHDPLTKIINHD